jgi:hypothetical protein
MNFLTTLNFDKHKVEKIWNFECFLDVSNSTYYYLFFEDEINCIMKIKMPFMKVVLLNEPVKHPLFKPNFDIEIFLDSF